MSIIERFAELLGSDSQNQPKRPATGQVAGNASGDLLERAVGSIGRRADIPEVRDFSADSLSIKAARPVPRSVRTFKIDRERLRRQSMITPDSERTPIAESFRRVKRQILANVASPRIDAPAANLILVTSAMPGEGKTFCAINLAISIALELDHTVLLVDADVAKPSILRELGLEAEKGLMDALLGRKVDPAEFICGTDIDRLSILPAGTGHQHATELLASETMRVLLKELSERHRERIVIFDSSPLLAASEASVLASRVGQIVVVVEAGLTPESTLKDALGRIDSTRVTGLLLNKGEGPKLRYGYGGYG